MAKFLLHWRGGKKQVVKGVDIATAFTRAGYGAGALPALDWYEFLDVKSRWQRLKHLDRVNSRLKQKTTWKISSFKKFKRGEFIAS